MLFPSLPTDHLYKFVALSGIVIIILTANQGFVSYMAYQKQLNDLEIDNVELDYDIFILDNHEAIGYLLKSKDTSSTALNELVQSSVGAMTHGDSLIDSIGKAIDEANIDGEQIFKEDQKETNLIIIKNLTSERNIVLSFWFSCFSIGMFATLWGFRMWYIKIQKPMDLKLMKEIDLPPK